MNERLSRLVAGLMAQAKSGEDLSTGINRIRTVIKKVIEGDDTIPGKLNALIESLREVIPDEKQRYQAAIKALTATYKLSREEIIAAANNQIEELKILEKVLISALPGQSQELKAMEAESRKMQNEISGLREKLAQLEKEEKKISDSMAGKGKQTAIIEKAVREVFTDIGSEISSIKKTVQDLSAEGAAPQPIPDTKTIKTDFPGQKEQTGGQKIATGRISRDAKQKTCPMCGAQMTFSWAGKRWQCFSCAYEELEREEVQSQNTESSAAAIFPEPAPASEPTKKCRMCGGRMDYYLDEKKWQCFSCGSEESEKGEVRGKSAELSADSIFPEPGKQPNAPAASGQSIFPGPGDLRNASEPAAPPVFPESFEHSNSAELKKQTISPETAPASDEKQKCPMCSGKMDYYIDEAKWQCYSCGFEYLKNEDGRAKSESQSKSEEKRDGSNVLVVIPPSESLFELSSAAKSLPGYWEPPKKTSRSKRQPLIKKKTCPGCGKKMLWRDNAWQCGHCGYERRI